MADASKSSVAQPPSSHDGTGSIRPTDLYRKLQDAVKGFFKCHGFSTIYAAIAVYKGARDLDRHPWDVIVPKPVEFDLDTVLTDPETFKILEEVPYLTVDVCQ